MCSALLAALLLDPERALAADEVAPPVPILGIEAPQDSTPLHGIVAPIREALPTLMPVPSAFSAASFGGEPRAPVRLAARDVLGLREMFTLSDTWRTTLPAKTDVRALQLGDEPIALAPANEEPLSTPNPLGAAPGTWFDQHIELTFNDGIAYKKNFTWRGMNLRLKIWGPFLKGDPGLGFRVRGLQLAGHGVEVRARATTDLQDLQVTIAF